MHYSVDEHRCLADVRAAARRPGPDCDSVDAYATQAWFENLERFGLPQDGGTVALCVGPAGTTDQAICLPLRREASGQAAVYGPVWSGLSNYYSSLYAPTGRAEHCTVDACRAALRHLRRAHGAAVIDLRPLDQDSAFFHHMRSALQAEGFVTDTFFCFGNWYLRVEGRSFDTYVQTVPSRIRNTVRRSRKKLDDAGPWDLRIVSHADQGLEQAIAEFDAVYRQSWKVPEPFPEFVPNLIRMAERCGWLRLGVVRHAGIPIAAQLWMVRDGHALIYKLAYDEAYKRFSAGSILTTEMMRLAIDTDRVVEIDYLTGDDAYKADWMSHRRERLGLVAFDPLTAQGLASATRHFGARWWRQVRPAPRAAAVAPAATPDEAAVSA